MFRKANDRFFGGELVEPKVIAYRRFPRNANYDGKTQFQDGTPIAILLDSRLKKFPTFAEIVLLHEMVHAKLGIMTDANGNEHAPYQFHVEIMRLWEAGAYGGLL